VKAKAGPEFTSQMEVSPSTKRDSLMEYAQGKQSDRVCLFAGGDGQAWDGRYWDQDALFVSRCFLLGTLTQSASWAKSPGSKVSCPSWLPSPPGKVKEAKMSILS